MMSLLDRVLTATENENPAVASHVAQNAAQSAPRAKVDPSGPDKPVAGESRPVERIPNLGQQPAVLTGDASMKADGDFVHRSQTMDAEFRNVSTGWTSRRDDPNDTSVMTYDAAREHIGRMRGETEDIVCSIDRFRPIVSDDRLRLEDQTTGREYRIAPFAMQQVAKKLTNIGRYGCENLASSDPDILRTVLDRGMRRIPEDKRFLIRTRNDGSIRAVLSDQYAIVDNRWFVDTLETIIPGGLVSHFRGDGDSIYFNVLIPDSIRAERDSEYGGMLASGNSEIGARRASSLPSIFRAICMNGCIWGEKQGIAYVKKVHRGEIKLAELASEIESNLKQQIPLLTTGVDSMLALREHQTSAKPRDVLAAALWQTQRQTSKAQADAMLLAHAVESDGGETSAFGIVNAVTRAAQKFDPAAQEYAEQTAGAMLEFDGDEWQSVFARAPKLTERELSKVYTKATLN